MLASLKETLKPRAGVEKILWFVLLLFVFAISFSIAVSHTLLALSAALYLYWKIRYDRKFPFIPILIPAAAFAYCTFLSVVFSIHPSGSFIHAKDLALLIIIPIFYDMVRDLDDIKVLYGILIFAGVLSACYGIYQSLGLETDLVSSRIKGFMGHWMTFSGLLMILNVLLLSHLLFFREHPLWFYPAFAILSLTLFLSLTRSVWIGFLAASFVLVALRRPRWVFAIPFVVCVITLVSFLMLPSTFSSRISSIFNPNETSNRDRLRMMTSGFEIIKDYPLTGVGSGMIEQVYPRYREPDSAFRQNQHLHNNVLQIAAENGILTLLAWLWLIGKVFYDLIHWKRNLMNREEQFMVYGTIGIVVSLFTAGMFEYNFGDSEIKMLFLTLITVPYAWHKQFVREEVELPQPYLIGAS